MLKLKFIWLLSAILLFSATFSWAASPPDYTIVYAFKNPDGTMFRIIRYYQRDGDKFRYDHLATVKYHVSGGQPLRAEQIPADAEADLILILRKDKGLVWSPDPPSQTYHEAPLKPDSWEKRNSGIFIPPDFKSAKTGAAKFLNYSCDIYESVRTVKEETWSNTVLVAQGSGVVLKTETRRNGELVQTMEAVEFSLAKPAAALFEVPARYQKSK